MIKRISYIESNTVNPYFNLALEEDLFCSCAEDQAILYLWSNSNTVVIGKNQNVWKECNVTKIDEDAVVIVRRMSGGGAVYHDTCNLNFTFICHRDNYDVDKQLSVIIDALGAFGVTAEKSGRNDILADGKKISGNAFYQRGDKCYHHGTLMVDVDIEKLSKYLTVSKAKLISKGVESVKSRVTNLAELQPLINISDLKRQLKESYEKIYEKKAEIMFPGDRDICHMAELMDKYTSWEWNFGKKMDFQYELTNKFDWGELMLQFNVSGGYIHELSVSCDSIDVDLAVYIENSLKGIKYDRREICEKLKIIGQKNDDAFYGVNYNQVIDDVIKWMNTVEL